MSEQLQAARAPDRPDTDNRILVISRIGSPPPHRGNRARMAALLVELRQLGYQVHFAGVRMSAPEKAATESLVDKWVGDFEVRQIPWGLARVWASLKFRIDWFLRRFRFVEDPFDNMFHDHWLGEARDLQQRHKYSRVLVPYINYSKFLEAFPDPCLRILDTIDAFSCQEKGQRARKVDWMAFSYSPEDETRGLLRAQHIIAIQGGEAAYFRQLVGAACKVYVVGHFAQVLDQPLPPASFLRLGCIGSSHSINLQGVQWFLREIWPNVRTRLPGAELWLAGAVCDQCSPAPGVRILGLVPHLADFYRDCPVLINPVQKGTGLKIKTIEALMYGRPVVTTSAGAEGLESFLGHGLFLCDSAKEFADAVVSLLSDLPQARQWGETSLRRVQSYCAENRRVLAAVLSK